MSKVELRKWAKNYRKTLDIDTRSNLLVKALKESLVYQNSKNIMIFYPLRYEINLLTLLDDESKKFYLPRIDGDNLLCCPFAKNDELNLSEFKTQEPKTQPVSKDCLDLIVVPALVVNKKNNRLGYGGGYYDRFLSDTKALKVTCIPKELIVDSEFSEPHDIRIDIVIAK